MLGRATGSLLGTSLSPRGPSSIFSVFESDLGAVEFPVKVFDVASSVVFGTSLIAVPLRFFVLRFR